MEDEARMRTKLADAPATKRDRIEIVAHDFGAMVGLNMALREGFWPSGEDMRRWCRLVALSDSGTTARLDSGALASERLAINKWRALDARDWLHEAPTVEVAAEHQARVAQLAARERWIEDRAAELAREASARVRDRYRAAALEEYRARVHR
jgi:hypothetical protein